MSDGKSGIAFPEMQEGGRMSRPSDGFAFDELRDEFDWMFEFQGRMAERISGDADVHSLADYVGKLEAKNSELREERDTYRDLVGLMVHPDIPDQLAAENAKLRELVKEMRVCLEDECKRCHEWGDTCDLEQEMRELGVEVDE